jgi:hypothetical protein
MRRKASPRSVSRMLEKGKCQLLSIRLRGIQGVRFWRSLSTASRGLHFLVSEIFSVVVYGM